MTDPEVLDGMIRSAENEITGRLGRIRNLLRRGHPSAEFSLLQQLATGRRLQVLLSLRECYGICPHCKDPVEPTFSCGWCH